MAPPGGRGMTDSSDVLARRGPATLPGGDVIRGSAAALAIKFTGSVLGFALFALAARSMGHVTFGELALSFNAMSFLAAIAVCGQETLITRSWNEYLGTGRPGLARGAALFGLRVVIGAAAVTAVVAAIAWAIFDRSLPFALPIAGGTFLFAQALMNFSAQLSRAAGGVVLGELPREIVWRFAVMVTILVHDFVHADFTATAFFFAAGAFLLVAALFQGWGVIRRLPPEVRSAEPEYDRRLWIPRSFRMWISATLETSSQYLEVIFVGLFLGPAAAGFYFVATRITAVFAMIAGSITTYATTQISGLYHSGEADRLQAVLRTLAIMAAVLVGSAFAIAILLGHVLLGIFGAIYASAYPALVVLSVGAALTALTGPAGYLLLLTGNEGVYPRIMAAGLLARFSLIAVLGSSFGLMGAAIAWSVSAAMVAVALVVTCRRRVGVDPSMFAALGFNGWSGLKERLRDA
jgi:O-antigen/teichoic acid export membrane protein